MSNTYCLVAAKSAGHILPALALAKQIKQKNHHATTIFITTNTSLDKKLVHASKLVSTHVSLPLNNIPYRKPWRLPVFCVQLAYSFFKSIRTLHKTKPERLVTTGGLVALPVCMAAWLLRIPIDVYELNVQPGTAVRWLSRLATHIYYCFDETAHFLPAHKQKKSDYPLFTRLDSPAKTYAKLGLDKNKKTIFILGGSQGSQWIGHTVKKLLGSEHKLAQSVNIIHQVGVHGHPMDWRTWYAEHDIPAFVFCYEPTCIPYYKTADIIICRSGAGTLHELAALHKPCITIPLEVRSTSHQVANALAMHQKQPNTFCVLRQSNVEKNPELLAKEIQKLLPLFLTKSNSNYP